MHYVGVGGNPYIIMCKYIGLSFYLVLFTRVVLTSLVLFGLSLTMDKPFSVIITVLFDAEKGLALALGMYIFFWRDQVTDCYADQVVGVSLTAD